MLVSSIFHFSSMFSKPTSELLENRILYYRVNKSHDSLLSVYPSPIRKMRKWFLAPLAVGQQAYVMVRLSVVCPSICVLTFSLNIFFSETTYRILMKFHRNVPAMVLFRIYWKNLILLKNCGCHGNKTEKKMKTLKIFLSETMRPRATKFGM